MNKDAEDHWTRALEAWEAANRVLKAVPEAHPDISSH
jgi:hypothetical protein